MLGGVVLDLVEVGERGLDAAGCVIGERGQVCCRAGSLYEDLGADVPVGPGGPDGRRDADEGNKLIPVRRMAVISDQLRRPGRATMPGC